MKGSPCLAGLEWSCLLFDIPPGTWLTEGVVRSSTVTHIATYYMQVHTPVAGVTGVWVGITSEKGTEGVWQVKRVWEGGENTSPVSEATQNSEKSKGTAQVLQSIYRMAEPNRAISSGSNLQNMKVRGAWGHFPVGVTFCYWILLLLSWFVESTESIESKANYGKTRLSLLSMKPIFDGRKAVVKCERSFE